MMPSDDTSTAGAASAPNKACTTSEGTERAVQAACGLADFVWEGGWHWSEACSQEVMVRADMMREVALWRCR